MEIRKFNCLEDCESAVQAQKDIWRAEDIDALPAHFLIAANGFARQWGVFEGVRLVALAPAYPADKSGEYLMHMLGVTPDKRGQGLGGKLLQSLIAELKKTGATKLFWTFDPFDFTNSHLYLNKTGALGTKILLNYYGRLHSAHHGALPTHRVFAELDLINPQPNFKQQTTLEMAHDAAGLRQIGHKEAAAIMDKFFNRAQQLSGEGWVAAGITPANCGAGVSLVFKR